MCRDDTWQTKYSKGKVISDCPIMLAESLAVREAMVISMQEKLSNIIIESDSQIVIHAIMGAIKIPSTISSIVKDIRILLSALGILNLYIVT